MATPATVPTTTGELLFQDYLASVQYSYEFEKSFPSKKKRPDYAVTKNGGLFLFDVKDFDPYMPLGFGAYDPYPRIREKIEEGRAKFKEFKEYPCSLVLKNNGNAFVHLEEPHIMLGAMYGNAGFRVPVYVGDGPMPKQKPRVKQAFLSGGKMIRGAQYQNTTISALITLRHIAVGIRQYRAMLSKYPQLSVTAALDAAEQYFPNFDFSETKLGVIVWENAVARIPLSRDLFTGPYDMRWGVENDQQSMVFRGDKLSKLPLDASPSGRMAFGADPRIR